jgi:hypothetical protein
LAPEKKEGDFHEDFSYSTETDTEFDIVQELKNAVRDIEKALLRPEKGDVSGTISYLKFLLGELDDSLSGPYEDLRHRRFITKKTV